MKKEKQCVVCMSIFLSIQDTAKYCSKKCLNIHLKKRCGRYGFKEQGISTGTVGAMSEILVSFDLMSKGFEVYRALSPASSCDLLAIKKGKMINFEVRTGYRGVNNGKISYPKTNIRAKLVAVVLYDKREVVYFPPLETLDLL